MRETDLPIKLFQTGDQKNSLSNGVPAIRILLENYKFRIPRGDAHSIEMTDIWIHEMTSMTIRNGKVTSLGDHDDTVSACWIAEQAIKNGSFDFSFEEEDGDDEAFNEMVQDMMVEPGHPEYLSDDEYVLGAEPPKRGRPRLKNAQLSEDVDDILSHDPLYEKKQRSQGVFPEEGAPMASYFIGKYQ